MRSSLRFLVVATSLVAACEDGPEQLFRPNDGDPEQQNGYEPAAPWVSGDQKGYGESAGGDAVGRALFCDEAEATAQVERMVVAPIIPDVSVGTVPLWAADGKPMHADDLLGRPEDGLLCNPTTEYANAFSYGPTDDIIVYFNQETRLLEGILAYQQYLGTMEGTFTEGGREVPLTIKPRERVSIDGRRLDQYTARADQASKPDAWMNYANITRVYKMVRETFFGAPPFSDTYDCVTEKTCNVFYESPESEETPQVTAFWFPDSGVEVDFEPDGTARLVYIGLVTAAPFEASGAVAFGTEGGAEMAVSFSSDARATCSLDLDEGLTFGQFKSRCVDAGDTRTLARVSYAVEDARDAVNLSFNAIDLTFLRSVSERPVFRDGESPADDDVLYAIGFTRLLNAPVSEFRARTLATAYKARLEERLREAVIADGPVPREQHPIALYSVNVPAMADSPQPLGEIQTTFGQVNWVPQIPEDVVGLYYSLTEEEQQMLDPRVLDPIWLLEPFVDGVLSAFSHGLSDGPDTFKVFRTTDDRKWCIGIAHFVQGGLPYRLQVQYSLNTGSVSAVFVERGMSDIDTVLAGVNEELTSGAEPYYTIELSSNPSNPYGLGGSAIQVSSFDRRLNTLTATLAQVLPSGAWGETVLTVPGDPIEDRNGYLRQLRGERYEFVPANVVKLYGKETSMVFYVEADGSIGRVEQNLFKGTIELCPGLGVSYGDDLRELVESWAEAATPDEYRNCDLVFNYSINGNVLLGVVSLANRVELSVIDGRAATAALWR